MKIVKAKDTPNAYRVVLFGTEGIGKTVTMGKLQDPLFLDLENSLYGSGISYIPTNVDKEISLSELLGDIEELRHDHQGYKSFVIDTADKLESMLIADMCKEYNKDSIDSWGWKVGYEMIKERFAKVLDALTGLTESGMNVCFTAHSFLRKQELPESRGSFDRYEMKLTKRVAPILKEWADLMIFVRYKTDIDLEDNSNKGHAYGGKRWVSCEHTAAWDGKCRPFVKFPDNVSLDKAVVALKDLLSNPIVPKKIVRKVVEKQVNQQPVNKPVDKPEEKKEEKPVEKQEESVKQTGGDFPPDNPEEDEETFERDNIKLMFRLMKQYNVLPDKLTKYLLDKGRFGNEIPPLEELPDNIVNWINRGMDKIAKKLQ